MDRLTALAESSVKKSEPASPKSFDSTDNGRMKAGNFSFGSKGKSTSMS